MREFLLSVIGVVVLSILFEVIFPAKRLKGALSLVFSLVTIFILSSGVKTLFKKDAELEFFNHSLVVEDSEVISLSVAETEKQLKTLLNKKGFSVSAVDLGYETDELEISFHEIKVKVDGEVDEEKLKDELIKIIDIERENIWVQN